MIGTESTPNQMLMHPSPTQTKPQTNGVSTAFQLDILSSLP